MTDAEVRHLECLDVLLDGAGGSSRALCEQRACEVARRWPTVRELHLRWHWEEIGHNRSVRPAWYVMRWALSRVGDDGELVLEGFELEDRLAGILNSSVRVWPVSPVLHW